MSLKNSIICGFLVVSCAILLYCERSDVLSGPGAGVVSDTDPTLTDTDRGFMRADLDISDVVAAYSLPAAPDPSFSTRQASGVMFVGKTNGDDTLTAHTQYEVTAFPANNRRYTAADIDGLLLDSAFIGFRSNDTLTAPISNIRIFRCSTLTGLRPIDRADTLVDWDIDNGVLVRHGNLTLTGNGTVDRVPLPPDIANEIFRVRTNTSTTPDTLHFAFSIVDYIEPAVSIRTPYIIIQVKKAGTAAPVRDSITGFTRNTAFENADHAPIRAVNAYSCRHTMRTAVFKIDISAIRDSVDALNARNPAVGRSELINAVIAFKAASVGAEAEAGTEIPIIDPAIDARNKGSYRIAVLDTLITTELPADDKADSLNLGLRNQFALSGTGPYVQAEPYNVSTIKTALRRALQSTNKSHIYVYLRPDINNGSEVLWDKPLKVETIFTPSRL